MGFFSWKAQNTGQTIWNKWSDHGPTHVVMIDDKGNAWEEQEYNGYGVFGGKDFYTLVAEMNGFSEEDLGGYGEGVAITKALTATDMLRWIGITLCLDAREEWSSKMQDRLIAYDPVYPNLYQVRGSSSGFTWYNSKPSSCDTQGYFDEDYPQDAANRVH